MEAKREKIGAVTLDYTYYIGEDLYCDGQTEDEILDVVMTQPAERYDEIIRERKSWEFLYHLSPIRENIVSWIPFTGCEKVLEIGAGPGAVTGALAARCASVTCVDLSRKRSLINAYRHRDCSNITIMVGNFADIEPHLDTDYDYIFLIGAFEYAGSYIAGETPFLTELECIRPHLRRADDAGKGEGRIVIAIENRLGLKYFAGCAEDHSGRYFDGIESYTGDHCPATTFSRPGLEKLLRQAGIGTYSFYYPYPDYKFAKTIYSDRRLPEYAELSDNICNFDRDRLLLFDERKAYKGITEDGLYPVFANSFEIVTGPALPVAYCKFSDDRAPGYRIRTDMILPEAGAPGEDKAPVQPLVRKFPLTPEAGEHVGRMPASCQRLKARYEESQVSQDAKVFGAASLMPGLKVAQCSAIEGSDGVSFEYIPGRTLESLFDVRLAARDTEGFLGLLKEYIRRVGKNDASSTSDCDMTFANIIVNGDMWTAIDYEWAAEEPIKADEMTARALLCYYRADQQRRARVDELIGVDRLFEMIGVDKAAVCCLEQQEDAFQQMVTGGNISLDGFRAMMGAQVIKPAQLQTPEELEEGRRIAEAAQAEAQRRQQELEEKRRALVMPQVYFDTGSGWREEESEFIREGYADEGIITFPVSVDAGVGNLRVDPALCPCVELIRDIRLDGQSAKTVFDKYMKTNGTRCEGGSVVFTGQDPWFSWDMEKIRRKLGKTGTLELTFELQLAGLPATMAEQMRSADTAGTSLFGRLFS